MQRLLTYILFRMPRPWIIEWPKLRLKLIWLVSIELAGGNSFIESVSLLPSDPPLSASIFQLMKFAKKYLNSDGPHSGEGKVIINLVNR